MTPMTHLPTKLPHFLWHFVKPYRAYAFGLMGAALVFALLMNLLGPYYLKQMIDTIASVEGKRAQIVSLILAPASIYVALFVVAGIDLRMVDWFRLRLRP